MEKCRSHPLFRELSKAEMDDDPCVQAMICETEEGKKVERSGAKKFYGVFQRVKDSDQKLSEAKGFFDKSNFGVILTSEEDEKEEAKDDDVTGTEGATAC